MLAAYCEMRPGVAQQPGIFGILYFPYGLLGHTKYFSSALNSMVVRVLEHRESGIYKLQRGRENKRQIDNNIIVIVIKTYQIRVV